MSISPIFSSSYAAPSVSTGSTPAASSTGAAASQQQIIGTLQTVVAALGESEELTATGASGASVSGGSTLSSAVAQLISDLDSSSSSSSAEIQAVLSSLLGGSQQGSGASSLSSLGSIIDTSA